MLCLTIVNQTINFHGLYMVNIHFAHPSPAPSDLPSGKRLRNELENHHAINGKTHYFNGHFQ